MQNPNEPTHRSFGARGKTSIEEATEAVIHDLNSAITHEWKTHGVELSEREFRSIIAGYFERKTLREWSEDLGISVSERTRST
jgi:hypothetical protein